MASFTNSFAVLSDDEEMPIAERPLTLDERICDLVLEMRDVYMDMARILGVWSANIDAAEDGRYDSGNESASGEDSTSSEDEDSENRSTAGDSEEECCESLAKDVGAQLPAAIEAVDADGAGSIGGGSKADPGEVEVKVAHPRSDCCVVSSQYNGAVVCLREDQSVAVTGPSASDVNSGFEEESTTEEEAAHSTLQSLSLSAEFLDDLAQAEEGWSHFHPEAQREFERAEFCSVAARCARLAKSRREFFARERQREDAEALAWFGLG